MYKFERTDTYKISTGKDIFKVDDKVLIRLYQPIIGATATSLYITLDSELTLNNKSRVLVTIDRLLTIMHISLKEFNDAIEALVNVKLVSLRANSRRENDYLFKLMPMENAFEFFNNSSLLNLLKEKSTETYYKQVQSYFMSSFIDEDEYVDINDVVKKEMTEEEFYESFLNKYEILRDSINVNVKMEVSRLKKLFNLKYEQIEIALFNSVASVNDSFIIDLNKLNNYVESTFKMETNDTDQINKYAESLEKMKPIAFYEQNIKRTLLPSEIKRLSTIQETYNLPNGVFNAILDYYFHYGNKQMGAPYGYLMKVSETIKAYGCETALDTMNYFRNISKIKKEPRVVKEEKKPLENKPNNGKIEVDNNIEQDKLDELLKLIGE